MEVEEQSSHAAVPVLERMDRLELMMEPRTERQGILSTGASFGICLDPGVESRNDLFPARGAILGSHDVRVRKTPIPRSVRRQPSEHLVMKLLNEHEVDRTRKALEKSAEGSFVLNGLENVGDGFGYRLALEHDALDVLLGERVAFDGVRPPRIQCAGPFPDGIWELFEVTSVWKRIEQGLQYYSFDQISPAKAY